MKKNNLIRKVKQGGCGAVDSGNGSDRGTAGKLYFAGGDGVAAEYRSRSNRTSCE